MATGTDKIAQYLGEARAAEEAGVRTLQAHVAMTPKGDYRKLLDRHLRETERQRDRLDARLRELGEGRGTLGAGVGALQSVAAEVLAVGKAPLDVVRGASGEEKLLKNAKDECATEALEIATYRTLQALAEQVEDPKTARLAETIRGEEETMLAALTELLPSLTEAVVRAEVTEPSYDPSTTGAADAAREAAARGRDAADGTRRRIAETAREAVELVATAARDAVRQIVEAADRGEDAVEETASAALGGVQGTAREAEGAVRDTAKAVRRDAGRRAGRAQGRAKATGSTTTRRQTGRRATRTSGRAKPAGTAARTGTQPWNGYDGQKVAEINKRITAGDAAMAARVRDYERANKARATIIERAKTKA